MPTIRIYWWCVVTKHSKLTMQFSYMYSHELDIMDTTNNKPCLIFRSTMTFRGNHKVIEKCDDSYFTTCTYIVNFPHLNNIPSSPVHEVYIAQLILTLYSVFSPSKGTNNKITWAALFDATFVIMILWTVTNLWWMIFYVI